MLIVNDSIKQAYNKYTTQRKSYIQIGENSFFVQNLDVTGDAYKDGNVIGNAIARIAKFDIETEYVKGLDEFELFDGIWTGNQYEYVSLGTFKLFNEKGTDHFFSSITAYDVLINFNGKYDPTKTTYPTTLFGLLQDVCVQAGVELENETIPNGDKILNDNLFVEDETLKVVLNAICQISGNYAIARGKKIKLLLKGESTITLDNSQISNPEYKRTTWKINRVVLGMTNVEGEYVLRQDEEDIAVNGIHQIVINDNPFVYTQALREEYIDELFNQVKGFGYISFTANWEGLSYAEIGDPVNIDGKESILLRYNLKSPDGLNSIIEAPSIIDSVIQYVDNSNSINNRQKRTEYSVNKMEQKITELVENTEEVLNAVKETMDVFSVDLETYTFSISTDNNKLPLETKDFSIKFFSYYKGQQVKATANTADSCEGIDLSFTSEAIVLSVSADKKITNSSNEIVINFIYEDGDEIYTLSKKVVISLSLQGKTGEAGKDGEQGPQGLPGTPGTNGTSTYFYVKYSVNSDGNPMTDAPTDETEYMGVASTTSPIAPTSYTAYTWNKTKGNDGKNGTDGTPGTPGANGLTSYLHVMYSEDGTMFVPEELDSEGNVIYALGKKPSAWIGQYADNYESDSTNFEDYSWYKFTEDIDDTLSQMQDDIASANTQINNNYQDLNNKIGNCATAESVTTITEKIEHITTSTEETIQIVRDIQVNGVSQVKTTKGYTFNDEGMLISDSSEPVKGLFNEKGVDITNVQSNTTILFAGYVDENNNKYAAYKGQTLLGADMAVVKKIVIGSHSRFEDYIDEDGNEGTGPFRI